MRRQRVSRHLGLHRQEMVRLGLDLGLWNLQMHFLLYPVTTACCRNENPDGEQVFFPNEQS